MRRRLILFDIDGTLLRPLGIGRRSLDRAFAERFGRADVFQGVGFHGRTDPDIVAEGVERVGGDLADVPQLISRYLDHLEAEVAASPSLLLPGVVSVLEALQETPGVRLGLVTGNVRRGAEIKLARDGIGRYFKTGAFGDDSTDRGELVRIARARALEDGHEAVGARAVFHIGDTESDVRAARFGDAVAVAVSTGGESHEHLASLLPDHLFRSLEPAALFVDTLLA